GVGPYRADRRERRACRSAALQAEPDLGRQQHGLHAGDDRASRHRDDQLALHEGPDRAAAQLRLRHARRGGTLHARPAQDGDLLGQGRSPAAGGAAHRVQRRAGVSDPSPLRGLVGPAAARGERPAGDAGQCHGQRLGAHHGDVHLSSPSHRRALRARREVRDLHRTGAAGRPDRVGGPPLTIFAKGADMSADVVRVPKRLAVALSVVVVLLFAASGAQANMRITIENVDAPGVGMNDPTPVAPVGGNPGFTLGQQRLFALQYAASLWATQLDSAVEVRIQARFQALNSDLLGNAGPTNLVRDFPGSQPNTWYPEALANKIAGQDLFPDVVSDIRATFDSDADFYLGLDAAPPAGQFDLVTVALARFARGLGLATPANLTTGGLVGGFSDVFMNHIFDLSAGKFWTAMTQAERAVSARNYGHVVWVG